MKKLHHVAAKTPLILRVVSLYVVIGSLISGYYFYVAPPSELAQASISVPVAAAATEPVQAKAEVITGVPRRIELARIGLTREVIDGAYDFNTNSWTLTDDKTQYATMTMPLSSVSGQTLIYGHNTAAVLEPVRLVESGDELVITADNGHVFTYTYSHDKVVQPTDTSVLYEKSEQPQVVLMTCEGVLSDTRRLLYFNFKAAV